RRRWRDDEAVGVRRIDIGESKAAGRAVAAGIFGHAAGDRAAADRDAVVDTGNGDLDILRGGFAVPVADGDRVGLDDALADREILGRGVVDVVMPGGAAVCRAGRL